MEIPDRIRMTGHRFWLTVYICIHTTQNYAIWWSG